LEIDIFTSGIAKFNETINGNIDATITFACCSSEDDDFGCVASLLVFFARELIASECWLVADGPHR
jgi:hypothetical protein